MTDTTVNKGGKPSIYTKELADRICDRLAEGESLRSICRDPSMPHRETILKWSYANRGEVLDDSGNIIEHGFYDQYTRARDIGLDMMADDLLDISDDSDQDWVDVEDKNGNIRRMLDKEAVMRSRLRVDTRKWYLSKMAPKRYGNEQIIRHQQLDGEGNGIDPVAPSGSEHILKAALEELEKLEAARNEPDTAS
jgi:hypothetical protein